MNEANFGESKNVERDSKKGTRNKYLRNTLLTYIGISSSVTFAEHQLGYSEEVTRPLKRTETSFCSRKRIITSTYIRPIS